MPFRARSIDSVNVIPSLKCDLECEHCCRRSGPRRKEYMSSAVLERTCEVVREIAYDHEPYLCISGGEPFQWPTLLERVVRYMPSKAFSEVLIITNGTWMESDAKRAWFWLNLYPKLQDLPSDWHETSISLSVSRDQYHRSRAYDVDRYILLFKSEMEDGFEWEVPWLYEEYHYPDTEGFHFCVRDSDILNPFPIGRGVNQWDWGAPYQARGCDSFPDQDSLTIWPDGRVSACCDGGAWVGNIMHQDIQTILRQRRAFLFDQHRKFVYPFPKRYCLEMKHCEKCQRRGRQFFGTAFRKES